MTVAYILHEGLRIFCPGNLRYQKYQVKINLFIPPVLLTFPFMKFNALQSWEKQCPDCQVSLLLKIIAINKLMKENFKKQLPRVRQER